MNRILSLLLIATVLALSGYVGGCVNTRTVLVPAGEPVQLAEAVSAYVYIEVDGQRERSSNRVTLPEGWWCLPDPEE